MVPYCSDISIVEENQLVMYFGIEQAVVAAFRKVTDMLPNIVRKSRITVYNYDSEWHSNAPQTRLQICGEDLIRSMHKALALQDLSTLQL